jgi:hypothetical protein
MSLDYDLSCIENRAENFPADENGLMNDKMHSLIWGCISTGIGKITEQNADEWFKRYAMITRIYGGVNYLTLDDVKNAVGLSTNVFPEKSRKEWFKALLIPVVDMEMERVLNEVNR